MTTTIAERVVLDVGQQEDFFFSEARYPAFFGGRGTGKTKALVLRVFAYAEEHSGARIVLTEDTYRHCLRILLPAIRREFGEREGTGWTFYASDMRIALHNGSEIFLVAAAESDRARGMELAAWGMDEAAIGHQEPTYLTLVPTLRQPGYPHHGWIATTPKGFNWLYRDWVEAAKPGCAAYYAATRDNHHLAEEDILAFEQAYGATPFAEQELGGRFVRGEGLVFPMFDPRLHVREPPGELKRYIGGIDFGIESPTAAIACGQDGLGRVWAMEEFYQRRATFDDLLKDVGQWTHCRSWRSDPSQQKGDIDFLRRQGLSIQAARTNKLDVRLRLIASRLQPQADGQPGLYISPSCPNLISELQTLCYAQARGLELLTDRTEGPDHACDALAYALMEFDMTLGERPRLPFRPEPAPAIWKRSL